MTERPILFNGEMMRAVLDGRKTMTRRVMKPQPEFCDDEWDSGWMWASSRYQGMLGMVSDKGTVESCSPYGKPGDRLWVRESWAVSNAYYGVKPSDIHDGARVAYAANRPMGLCIRPSIHMPRWASRITLEVTAVRVERVQDISQDDAIAEGCDGKALTGDPCDEFAELWDGIAKRGFGWDANPWCWVVEFKQEA